MTHAPLPSAMSRFDISSKSAGDLERDRFGVAQMRDMLYNASSEYQVVSHMVSECQSVHQKTNEKLGDFTSSLEELQEIELLTARLTSLETAIAEKTLTFAEKTTEKDNTKATTAMNTNRAAVRFLVSHGCVRTHPNWRLRVRFLNVSNRL